MDPTPFKYTPLFTLVDALPYNVAATLFTESYTTDDDDTLKSQLYVGENGEVVNEVEYISVGG